MNTSRFKIINQIIFVLIIIIIIKILYIVLFVDSYDSFETSSELRERELLLPRRTIVDRNNFPLAVSLEVFDILINPNKIAKQSISLLAEIFDDEKLTNQLDTIKVNLLYKRAATPELVEQIKNQI